MAAQSLLHEILMALLGHTGACISPLIEAQTDEHEGDGSALASASASVAPRFIVTGLVLAPEVPFVTPAERAAINTILQAGYAYVRIMHFVQNIDAGATAATARGSGAASTLATAAQGSDAFAPATDPAGGGHVGLRTTLASTALEQRALDAQQARHVYAAAGAMFSPPKKQRPARHGDDEEEEQQERRGNAMAMALVPMNQPLHPLLETPAAQAAQPKGQGALYPCPCSPLYSPHARSSPPAVAHCSPPVSVAVASLPCFCPAVGLYLRALGLGLEEILSGYRALILKVEQDILAEIAGDPSTAPTPASTAAADDTGAAQAPPPPQLRRIEYGLAKLTLALRQYLVILPALQNVIETIAASKHSTATANATAAATEANSASSPNPSPAAVAESPSSAAGAAAGAPSPAFHSHGIHGLRLLAYLSVASQTGVPVLREVFASLLSKLRRVLHNQLQAWCFRGVLVDPFEEFFIQAEPVPTLSTTSGPTSGAAHAVSSAVAFGGSAAKSAPLDWDRSYTLRLSQLPLDFLPELGGGGMATVHRVLFVGKAVLVLSAREAAEEAQRRKKQGALRADHARRSSNAMWNAAAAAAAAATATAQHSRIGSLSATPLANHGAASGGLRTPLSVRSASATPRFEPSSAHANGTFARGFGAATASISHTAAATPAVVPAAPTVSLLAECQPLISAFQALQHSGGSSGGGGGGDGGGPDFESLLHDLSRVVSRRLYLALVGPGCSLLTHLFHLKSFVLGGSGEFAGAFIDLAESGVIGGAGAGAGAAGTGSYAGGLFSRALTPQVLARMDRDLNGSNGPLKQSLAYAGCNLEFDSDEADGLGGGTGSSREEAAALANYAVKHLTFHLSPDPSIAAASNAAAAAPSVLSPSAAAAAAAASASGSPSQSAWSLLRFEYRVSAPLDLIFLPSVMAQYNRLFRFLMQARRVQQSVQSLWQSSMRLKGAYTPRASTAWLPALLLRHSMSHFLDSLLSYLCVDVVGSSWARLVDQISATSEFEQVKRAHEAYVEAITMGAFLRERIISGAIHDLLDTCMLMVRSATSAAGSMQPHAHAQSQSQAQSPVLPPSSPVFLRLSGDFQRQLCFLHSLLVAKTDFGGGGLGGFRVASLVARLDYNGYITRLSSTLGLGRAQQTKMVPAAQGRGTVTSAAAIAQSMGRPATTASGGPGAPPTAHSRGGGNEMAAATSVAAFAAAQSKRPPPGPVPSAAGAAASSTALGARSTAGFTPAHLAASSLTAQFAAGSARPPPAPRGGGGYDGPTSY